MAQALPQPQRPRQVVQKGLVDLPAVEQKGQGDVFLHVQHGNEVEKLIDQADLAPAEDGEIGFAQAVNVGVVDVYLSRGGGVDPAQNVQKGGFAGTGRADDGDEIPFLDGEGDVVQRPDGGVALAVYLAQVFDSQNVHGLTSQMMMLSGYGSRMTVW